MRSILRWGKLPPVTLLIVLASSGTASAQISSLSIDETATLSPGHQAIVLTGTITCPAGEIWAISQARVIQGQRSGFGSAFSLTCTGGLQQWSLPVISSEGLFHRGRASAGITVIGGGQFGQVQLDRFVRVVG
jgi:hypothetical protein